MLQGGVQRSSNLHAETLFSDPQLPVALDVHQKPYTFLLALMGLLCQGLL